MIAPFRIQSPLGLALVGAAIAVLSYLWTHGTPAHRTVPADVATMHVHLVGGGIASLAAAVFLVQNTSVPGAHIHIYDETALLGGALDAMGNAKDGFVMRGGRMIEGESYTAIRALFQALPYTRPPEELISEYTRTYLDAAKDSEFRTMLDDYENFNENFPINSTWRLIDADGQRIRTEAHLLTLADKVAMLKLTVVPEWTLNGKSIAEVMPATFFQSNFWWGWASMLSFQPWHSAIEMQRYLNRFVHCFPTLATMTWVRRTRFNNYFSIVHPALQLLRARGVQLHMNTRVEDVTFETLAPAGLRSPAHTAVRALQLEDVKTHAQSEVKLSAGDRVFFTVGSIVADSVLGSHTKAPVPRLPKPVSGAFRLWEKMIAKLPQAPLGRPQVFYKDIAKSQWVSYTCTFYHGDVLAATYKPYGNSLLTFPRSSWGLNFIIKGLEPHFPNVPKGVVLAWGYGLFMNTTGDFVHKTMLEATGEDFLTETLAHLRWTDPRLKNATCIPAYMPYITSHFMPRAVSDRPDVVPAGAVNYALLGQFVDIPEEAVFTIEQSTRAAMLAVQQLVDDRLTVPPIPHTRYDPAVLWRALDTMNW